MGVHPDKSHPFSCVSFSWAKVASPTLRSQYSQLVNESSHRSPSSCYHCGDPVASQHIRLEEKTFCCEGCKTVYQLLAENGMCTYYDLETHPGIPLRITGCSEEYAWLDQPEIRLRLLDFRDESQERVRFFLPQIHCSSCIWLLENLYRLRAGVHQSRVDFLKKEISLSYDPAQTSLRELAQLLATLGYAPEIRLSDANKPRKKRNNRGFYLQLGIAGFAYGNIMLMSFPEYLGMDVGLDGQFVRFFGLINLVLALPVLLYSATGFYRSAYFGLKEGHLNIDVPISIGILVLFGRSAWEILSHTGPGYMDSLAGLVFFLLAGRWFQNKTYDSLSFDRDFTAYFPLVATRITPQGEESCVVTSLSPGDRILVRHQELIPADSILRSTEAHIDYSFVTGESDPIRKQQGDTLYAGGRQMGDSIELSLIKEVSQSYLTQLWNDEAFLKNDESRLRTFTDGTAKYFTAMILLVGLVAGGYWWWAAGLGMAVNVFTAVLIIACPCALALSIPVTLGNAMRILGHQRMYLKNTRVLERLAEISKIVWDKTGTMTQKGGSKDLEVLLSPSQEEQGYIARAAAQSTHPMSRALSLAWKASEAVAYGWKEYPGQGGHAEVAGHSVVIGKADFVASTLSTQTREFGDQRESGTWLAVDDRLVGIVRLKQAYRTGLPSLVRRLGTRYAQAILSGDRADEAQRLQAFFPKGTDMRFEQTPQHKLAFIRAEQEKGEKVMMIGDGLNDAGAFRQSDVGIAVAEDIHTFSPACDLILDAESVSHVDRLLDFSRGSMRWVKRGLVLSLAYNLVGLSFAVQGWLSPLIAAILMPISSITVVLVGIGATWWLKWRIFDQYLPSPLYLSEIAPREDSWVGPLHTMSSELQDHRPS